MEALIMLFIALDLAFVSLVFVYFAYKLIQPELSLPKINKKGDEDKFTKTKRIPIERFMPNPSKPLKIEEEDKITR